MAIPPPPGLMRGPPGVPIMRAPPAGMMYPRPIPPGPPQINYPSQDPSRMGAVEKKE